MINHALLSSPLFSLAVASPAIIVLGTTVVLAILFANGSFFKHVKGSDQRHTHFEDKDGSGLTIDTRSTWQRISVALIAALTVVRLILQVALPSPDGTLRLAWADLGWVAIVALCPFFILTSRSITRYNIGLATAIAILPLVILEISKLISHPASSKLLDARQLFESLQIILGIVLAVCLTSVRRRPRLHKDGRQVDDRNSTSFLSRCASLGEASG